MSNPNTVAGVIADALARRGVPRLFGIPGGGSSLELIDACAARGIDYVLTHTEAAAAIMASVTGELTGTPGVVSTGLGPGASAAANGVAYAMLDRSPLLVVTDSFREGSHDFITHQKFDQSALFAPITKAQATARPGDAAQTVDQLLDIAMASPQGPVHLNMTAVDAGAETAPLASQAGAPDDSTVDGDIAAAQALLNQARRPVVIAGLQARDDESASAARALAARLACPVMTTYKAKGVFPDSDTHHGGLFTAGSAEAPWLADADLIVLFGLDPVELVAAPWSYEAPVLEMAATKIRPHYMEPAATLTGAFPAMVDALAEAGMPANWDQVPVTTMPDGETDGRLSAFEAVRAVIEAAPDAARATVDAGAHMLPVMPTWPAHKPNDLLISNGLSTMGFAVPAAIAAALVAPDRPVVAFTGDGGMAMCLAELATAARVGLPVVVVVMNDAALSLIDVKQQQRGFETRGVRYPALDFRSVAEGLGCLGATAGTAGELAAALTRSFNHRGPSVIDVRIDPGPYRAQLEALRGNPGATVGRA